MSMMMNDLRSSPVIAMLAESDIQQGRAFWRDTLGFQEVEYASQMQEALYQAGQGTYFAIYQHQGGSKCDHTQLAFEVPNFDSTVDYLRQQGVRFEEYNLPQLKTMNGVAMMPDGTKGAWFKDPGGNIVGIFTQSPFTQRITGRQTAGVGATTGMGGGTTGGGMGGTTGGGMGGTTGGYGAGI